MQRTSRIPVVAFVIALLALTSVAVAVWLFPDAVPQIALKQELTRGQAEERAAQFARSHQLPLPNGRTAVRFESDDSLRTFVELGAGGKNQLGTLVRGGDVSLFSWAVRFFTPGDVHETAVRFGADGRIMAFKSSLADADRRPNISPDSARAPCRQCPGAVARPRHDAVSDPHLFI